MLIKYRQHRHYKKKQEYLYIIFIIFKIKPIDKNRKNYYLNEIKSI